jgi:polysaccharide pyruvyl transferase WcaK-like protein
MAIALGGDNFSLDYGSPRYQFEILAHAREKGVPTAIWGASIGPFDRSPDDLKLAKEELPKASLITVRESISRDYLASMGITDNVKLVADPAFVLPAREVELPASVTDALETGCVGVNISPLLGTYLSTGEDWLDLTAALLKAVDDASDVPVILIPHVVRSQKNDNDWEFMHQALRRLGAARNAFFELPAALNACELKWVISKLTAFVGARTHATIAALSSQIPTLSLGYSVKAEGINKDIFGHTDWVLPLGNITPGSLKEQTQALLGSQKAVRQHLQETMPRYTKLAWDGGRHVAEFMRDGHIS